MSRLSFSVSTSFHPPAVARNASHSASLILRRRRGPRRVGARRRPAAVAFALHDITASRAGLLRPETELGRAAAEGGEAARMRMWMDVMRRVEPIMPDHERLFEAGGAGGVDGLVIGPMAFDDKSYPFDPNPEVYRRFGLEAPAHSGESSLW